jgi:nitronate monooxygenase
MADSLLRRLQISAPVVQAPMAGGWTTPALVAAVAEAGAFGMLAGARLGADDLRHQIAEVRGRTGRMFGWSASPWDRPPPTWSGCTGAASS